MPQTKKTTGTARKTSGKKTTAKKQTKTAPAKNARNAESYEFLSQAAPYILAAVAILLAVCIVIGEGRVGGGIKDFFTGLFSGAAYALPLFILVRAFLWKRDSAEGQNYGRNSCTVIVFLCLTMLLHIVGGGENELSLKLHYGDGMRLVGGGAVGGILGELLFRGFGKVCSVIILAAVIVILSLYVAGLTPKGIYIWIAYHIKFAGEKRAERAEKRRNAPPTSRAIKEEEYLNYLREKKRREKEAAQAKLTEEPKEEQTKKPREKKNTQPATVYRVTKRRLTEMDIPVDDITPPEVQKAGEIEGFEEPAPLPAEPEEYDESEYNTAVDERNSAVVDEKIFDEVMRRTKERIEKGKRTDSLRDTDETEIKPKVIDVPAPASETSAATTVAEIPAEPVTAPALEKTVTPGSDESDFGDIADESIDAGDVLDAVEIAAMSIHDKAKTADEYETDTVKLAMTSADDEPPFDVDDTQKSELVLKPAAKAQTDENGLDISQIFTGDGEDLINKVSEAHSKESLTIKREAVAQNATLPTAEKPMKPSAPEYKFPPKELLSSGDGNVQVDINGELSENASKLVETLRSFNVKVKNKVEYVRGPTITRYELTPEPGTRVSSIRNLVDDIALNLATTGVRIEAPIPGKSAVGIEVPNKKQETVHLRTLIDSPKFKEAKSKLTVCLGEDVAGEPVYFDIAKMPHLLIAGTTGSGKSVCINSIIMSILYKAKSEEVKLILVDPKKVELSIYNGIPHLLVPVISDTKNAASALSWAVGEMERRYGLLESVGVREITAYNRAIEGNPDYEQMYRIVIIIDELADFMMTAPDAVEDSICRIAQKARAAGMHLILGTQRPSTNVITGLIKANIPSRIAFTVSNNTDSRVILDKGGAENLIGKGDMLFSPVGALKLRRVQGAFVTETEVDEVVKYIKNMNADYKPYSEAVVNQIEREAQKFDTGSGKKGASAADEDDGDEDPMLDAAIELAIESKKISTSLIQRRLSLGYGRAAKLIDRMESLGYVSAQEGQKPREVLITKQEYMEMRLNNDID